MCECSCNCDGRRLGDMYHYNHWDDITAEDRRKLFILMDTIRDAGVVNMLGAGRYLMEHYNVKRNVSYMVSKKWRDNFDVQAELTKMLLGDN